MSRTWGDRPIRVAMVGTGFVAPYHTAGWRQAGAEVVCAVTRNPAGAATRLAQLRIPAGYATLEEAIERARPDVIDICSPPERHRADCETAAAAGLPFMCQKPLAPSMEAAQAIARAADAAGVRAMVHENFRFRPWNRALRAELDAGSIGTPFFARLWERKAGTVTTADHPKTPWSIARQPQHAKARPFLILESVIHQIDVARYLFGEPRLVFARARRVSPHVVAEDCALLTLTFDAMDVSIERSYASKGYPPAESGGGEQIVAEGSEGTIFLAGDGSLRVVRDGPGGREEHTPFVDTRDAYARSYADCIGHFVAGLRSGAAFETALNDNLKTLAAVFAAYRSSETGAAVDISTFGS